MSNIISVVYVTINWSVMGELYE